MYAGLKQAAGYVFTVVNPKGLQAGETETVEKMKMYYSQLSCNGSQSQLRCDCMDK